MLFNTNKEMDYMYKLILIINHFKNNNDKYIKEISRGGYNILNMPEHETCHIDNDEVMSFIHNEDIVFAHTSGYPLGVYSLNEDNTLDKLINDEEDEILIEKFANGLYSELELLN